MQPVSERHDFPAEEEKLVALWERIDAFRTSVARSKAERRPEYTFYDGPPFATGLPHYGHILAGTIKDTVTRYAHQTGHYVERRFGWDCHGLPIEFEIDKERGIKTKEEVLAWGIDNYNEACRAIVMRYSGEWRKIVTRLGRWIDFDHDYKTMDCSFMESVWWVFSQLHAKGLVYRGFKVMPYSTACTTPLSNFEANLNYKDAQDPAIVVSFPLQNEPEVSLLAWTTTPWTLPSNLALCVNAEMDYVRVKDTASGQQYILAEARLSQLYKADDEGKAFTKVTSMKGSQLVGLKYTPLFDYFQAEYGAKGFKVVSDNYVSSESGTGIVHQAPGFGEDDYRVCLREGIIEKTKLPCPVDDNGRFTAEVTDFAGQYVKEADKAIQKTLKTKNRLVQQSQLTHSYPFCWRSDTPLIYRTIPSWFVNVEVLKDRLVKHNLATYWVPAFVKEKRFHNWLEDARDWAISRNRYWGTPLPIWTNADYSEIVVIGSIADLEQRSGVKGITDLHSHKIDHITIPSASGKGVLKRVPEVFDCWFESGSMPYAQQHYPFENKDVFERNFPAQFIAEGIDQTRGWFYTLLVISTALFDQPPFKNLIVNGLVLASDGKKMSKRLKNYPDPNEVIKKYGADALRLYLINSPVVRGENLKFVESGVSDVIRDVFLRWFNAYRLLVQNVLRAQEAGRSVTVGSSVQAAEEDLSVMDRWILAATQSLVTFVRAEMAAYRLYTVVPRLVNFINDLANWYVRLNRARFKGQDGLKAELSALRTLARVQLTLATAMSPFTPFFSEFLYQNLRNLVPAKEREDSIHYLPYPNPDNSLLDVTLERRVARMQQVIELGRLARERRRKPLKQPLAELVVYQSTQEFLDDVKALESYILDELNVRTLVLKLEKGGAAIALKPVPDNKRLGQRFRGDKKKIEDGIQKLSKAQLEEFDAKGEMKVEGHLLTKEDVNLVREFTGDNTVFEAAWNDQVLAVLHVAPDEALELEGHMREVQNRIQRLRKAAGLYANDTRAISVYWTLTHAQSKEAANSAAAVRKAIGHYAGGLQKKTKCSLVEGNAPQGAQVLQQSTSKVNNVDYNVVLVVENPQ